jgi:hypothetical protein
MKLKIIIPKNVNSRLSVINALKVCVSNPKEITTKILKEKLPLSINTTIKELEFNEINKMLDILEENGVKTELFVPVKKLSQKEKEEALKEIMDNIKNYCLIKDNHSNLKYKLYLKDGYYLIEDSRTHDYIVGKLLKTDIEIKESF